jgi:hypothetical protein
MKDDKPSSIEAAVPHPTVETDMSTSANEPLAVSQSHTSITPELVFSLRQPVFSAKLESFNVAVMHLDGRRHVMAYIYILDRHKYKGRFRELLKDVMLGNMNCIADLFDDNGCLNKWLIDSDFYRGNGCWGREMDDGSMAFLELSTVRYLSLGIKTYSLKSSTEQK